MPVHDYLSLQLVRLTIGEDRAVGGNGLTFVFPTGGAGKCISGPVVHPLWPGEVLVLNGAKHAKICVAKAVEMVFWLFTASLEHLFPLFACDEICRLEGIEAAFKPTKLYPASSPVAKECHRLLAEAPARFGLDHRGQLLRVITAILSAEFKNLPLPRNSFTPSEQHMSQVFEKLSVTEILSLSIDQLAGRFGCSRRHLNRLFHQHFGVSVSALRMEMRLLRAMSLLRDPGAKVFKVAEKSGFNHLGLFNACFKRRFNVSPGLWQKKMSNVRAPSAEAVLGEAACRIRGLGLCPLAGQNPVGSPTRSGDLGSD